MIIPGMFFPVTML